MSQPGTVPPRRAPAGKQIPPEVSEIISSSLQVGAGAGVVGLFVGATSGIVRSATPVLFSLVTGAQWFALGSSYYAARRTAITHWGGDNAVTTTDKVKASAIGGATAGLVGGALRGPKNILPAVAVVSLFGAAGQSIYNRLPERDTEADSKMTSWLDSKWSPVKPLTDADYATFLEEKILKLEVDIAMMDEKIAEIKAAKARKAAEKGADASIDTKRS